MKLNYGQHILSHIHSLPWENCSQLLLQHCEDCVFCPCWRVKECRRENAWGGQREGSHLDCGSWFFPEDHGKGNSEHPHNRMLMHSDKCDHGSGGGWMGGQWGLCFQCRGGGETENWVWLICFWGGRGVEGENTLEVSNSGMMCWGFRTTRACFFGPVQSESRPPPMILLHFPSLSFWWERESSSFKLRWKD